MVSVGTRVAGAALDTNPADIGPLNGVAAAGATGMGADAGHAHTMPVTRVAGNHTIAAADVILECTNAAPATINLPAATVAYRTVIIKVTSGQVTVHPNGTDTIDTLNADLVLPISGSGQNNAYCWLISDGAGNWNNMSPPAINTLAAAIQPIGPRTAGTTGNPADGGHAHATRNLSAALGADVAVSGANAWTTALSVNIPNAGLWLIEGQLTINPTTGATMTLGARLQDTTTPATLASGQGTTPAVTGDAITISVCWIYNAPGAVTVALQGISTSASANMKAALTSNGSGNNATTLVAVQIG